jgi:hypothetical protein
MHGLKTQIFTTGLSFAEVKTDKAYWKKIAQINYVVETLNSQSNGNTSALHIVQNKASSPSTWFTESSNFLQSALINNAQINPPRKHLLELLGSCELRFILASPTVKPARLERPFRELRQVDVGEFASVASSTFSGKLASSKSAVLAGASVKPSSNFDMIPGSAGFMLVHRM